MSDSRTLERLHPIPTMLPLQRPHIDACPPLSSAPRIQESEVKMLGTDDVLNIILYQSSPGTPVEEPSRVSPVDNSADNSPSLHALRPVVQVCVEPRHLRRFARRHAVHTEKTLNCLATSASALLISRCFLTASTERNSCQAAGHELTER